VHRENGGRHRHHPRPVVLRVARLSGDAAVAARLRLESGAAGDLRGNDGRVGDHLFSLCGAPMNPTWLEQSRTLTQAQLDGDAGDPKLWPSPCEVCGAMWRRTPAGNWTITHFSHAKGARP